MKLSLKYKALLLNLVPFLFSIPFLFFRFDPVEFFFFDLRQRLQWPKTASGEVVQIIYDIESVEKLGGIPTYPQHAQLIKKLHSFNPKAIVYVSALLRSTESPEDSERSVTAPENQEGLKEFAIVANQIPQLYKFSSTMKLKGETGGLSLPAPLDQVKVLSAPPTSDSSSFAKDGVSRRIVLDYQGETLGQVQIAELANSRPIEQLRGRFLHYETHQLWVDFLKKNKIKKLKFEDIVSATNDNLENFRSELNGKILLIGDDLKKNFASYVSTPLSHDPAAMTLTELQAQMIDTLIRNSAPTAAPMWLNWLLTSLVCGLTLRAVLTMRPAKGLGVLALTTISLSLVGLLAYWINGLMLAMSPAYLAIFICYYFFIPYRLIVENKKSFEYFEKHRLLQQVEELKTNFISMMSHDLKTPLARIQGMTEVIVSEPIVLSPKQQEALDHIRSSTEDLSRFVSSILNYARIETEGVVLHKESRDINEILQAAIQRHEFHAKMKSIQIQTELEPLFSIAVDPDLIKQVFGNLIENAIKYSPKGSKVLVTSEERDQRIFVQISDQGQGIPTDELPNIFHKFFRSQSAKISTVKGSGLGLYLSKYFVDLHKGELSVESVLDQGSTFTVSLPLK